MNILPPVTFIEQERHLHEQYIAGLIEPYKYEFCVCGNLKGERVEFSLDMRYRHWPLLSYSGPELFAIEGALLDTIVDETSHDIESPLKHPNYENALFNGMVASIEVLKKIHLERGEIIEECEPMFTKIATLAKQ